MSPASFSVPAFAVFLALAFPSAVRAQLATVETPEMRLVYIDGTESYLVPHAARTFLNSLAFQKRLFGLDPPEPVTVLLADFSDQGNAAASVVPYDVITVQIAPLNFAFETIAANERLNTIMNHELVHTATMDPAAGPDRFFRRLFGGKVAPVVEHPETILYLYLTAPRVAAPRWYHEGIAVFVDTWMAGGIGRAQSGYDEMVFRSMVKDGAPFYDPLGLVSEGTKVDFQLQINSYLYGARFMTWLARRYSPERLVAWVSRPAGSRGYYASQFRAVFGRSLESAWAEWIADERTFQHANLAAIRQYPLTPYRDVTGRALGSVSRAYLDRKTGRLLGAFNYPGAVAHVGAIDLASGAVRRIRDIKGPVIYTVTSLAWNPDDRALFYTTDNGALRDLVRLDPDTGRAELLQKDLRVGDLAYDASDRSLWGIRHLNGLCTLVRIPPPWRSWEQVHTWPYGTVVYDLDVSPDGRRLVAAFGEVTGRQDVRVFTREAVLSGGTPEPERRFDFGTAVPTGFVFSPDGRYLFGGSYYTGVSNIFRYDLEKGAWDAVSNTDTGFFRPIPLGGDDVLVFRYTGAGFVPARIEARPLEDIAPITFLGERLIAEHPVLATWKLGSPADVPFDDMNRRQGEYRLAGGLRRESFYPVVLGYKDAPAAGFRVNLSDPLQINRASVLAAWSPAGDVADAERLHLHAEYRRYDWRARVDLNRADFYDLFGPTKVGRKGYAVSLGHTNTLVYDEPTRLDLAVEGRVAGNLDRLPAYQNVEVDVTSLVSLEATLTFTDVRNSLGHVDDESGRKWQLVALADYVDGTLFPKVYGSFDQGLPLGWGHSSIWLRGAAGAGARDRSSPFSNFYFGAFGNNWVDHRDEKRYRSFHSFPGADLNEIAGRTFVKGTVEWTLPPWRFRRAGTPGFHATWARPALFVTALGTDVEAPDVRRGALSAGGQLDFRFSMISQLDLTLSIGGAVAVEDGHAPRREAMVSLKILR